MPTTPPEPGANDELPQARYPKAYRLLRRADFDAVFAQGRARSRGDVTVLMREREPGELPHDATRLGIIVTKKHGSAPRRNRLKRIVREAFRLLHAGFPPRLDVVVMPRATIATSIGMPAIRDVLAETVRLPLPDSRPRKRRGRGGGKGRSEAAARTGERRSESASRSDAGPPTQP
jgi:ribonuclease P protein component